MRRRPPLIFQFSEPSPFTWIDLGPEVIRLVTQAVSVRHAESTVMVQSTAHGPRPTARRLRRLPCTPACGNHRPGPQRRQPRACCSFSRLASRTEGPSRRLSPGYQLAERKRQATGDTARPGGDLAGAGPPRAGRSSSGRLEQAHSSVHHRGRRLLIRSSGSPGPSRTSCGRPRAALQKATGPSKPGTGGLMFPSCGSRRSGEGHGDHTTMRYVSGNW